VKSLTFVFLIIVISPIVIFSQDIIADDFERFKDKRFQEIHDPLLWKFVNPMEFHVQPVRSHIGIQDSDRWKMDQTRHNTRSFQKILRNWTGKQSLIENEFLLKEELYQSRELDQWKNNRRFVYKYDGQNNQIEFLDQYWDREIWLIYLKVSDTYDYRNNRTDHLFQQWDWGDGLWQRSKHSYKYDDNDNMIEDQYLDWDETGEIRYGFKDLFIHNEDITEVLGYRWKDGEWVLSYKSTRRYNEDDNLIEYLTQRWDGADWINNWSGYYEYDENDNRIEQFSQEWNGYEWENAYQSFSTFDSNNNQTESINQIWDTTSDRWLTNWTSSQTYNENSDVIEYIEQYFEDSIVTSGSTGFYTYDDNFNCIEFVRQEWDIVSASWLNDRKYINKYDSNNNEIESQSQIWWGTRWINSLKWENTYDQYNNLIEIISYNWRDDEWEYWSKVNRTYTAKNVSKQPINMFKLSQSYPNPFNSTSTIEYRIASDSPVQLAIYNSLGQEVARLVDQDQRAGTYVVDWDASQVASGVYFYHLISGDIQEAKKMVLVK
jgi:hypothetical protein